MYSQNKEEQFILAYYPTWFKGIFLDLGANDGMTLSNTRALLERGWKGFYVEPDEDAFAALHANTPFENKYKLAIANEDGFAEFTSTGDHLHKGDKGLLSTLRPEGLARFPGELEKAKKYQVETLTFKTFLDRAQQKTFDFMSIDCEYMDLEILMQIDLLATGTSCVCIEFNGVDEYLFDRQFKKFGMKQIHKNGENLIYAL